MYMKNSVIANSFNKFFTLVRNVFESSNLYKIFNPKSKPSKSKIIRKSIDDDIIKYSKTYNIIKKMEPDSAPSNFNSKILNALFLEEQAPIVYLTGALLFFVGVVMGAPLKISIALFVLCNLTKFTQDLIRNEWYKSSIFVRFFTYAYKLEDRDGEN